MRNLLSSVLALGLVASSAMAADLSNASLAAGKPAGIQKADLSTPTLGLLIIGGGALIALVAIASQGSSVTAASAAGGSTGGSSSTTTTS